MKDTWRNCCELQAEGRERNNEQLRKTDPSMIAMNNDCRVLCNMKPIESIQHQACAEVGP